MTSAQTRTLERKKRQFVAAVAKLDAMSPLKVLTRGYALVKTEGGEVLKSIHQVEPGDRIRISLSDGSVTAAVSDKEETL